MLVARIALDSCIGVVCGNVCVKSMLELRMLGWSPPHPWTDHSGPIINDAPMEHATKVAEAKPSIISSVGQPSGLVVNGKVHSDYGGFGSCKAEMRGRHPLCPQRMSINESPDRKYSNRKCHENCGCIAHNK